MAVQSLKPRIDMIKARYGDDDKRVQEETKTLYAKAEVNPYAGCLPSIATIPVFIGLYRSLTEVTGVQRRALGAGASRAAAQGQEERRHRSKQSRGAVRASKSAVHLGSSSAWPVAFTCRPAPWLLRARRCVANGRPSGAHPAARIVHLIDRWQRRAFWMQRAFIGSPTLRAPPPSRPGAPSGCGR
jgi:hypothetical protein